MVGYFFAVPSLLKSSVTDTDTSKSPKFYPNPSNVIKERSPGSTSPPILY